MGNCISESKALKDKRRSSSRHQNGQFTNYVTIPLTIIPGDLENIGYLMHDVIVRNNLNKCSHLLEMGFPINTPLKYSSSVPASTGTRITIERVLYYEFYGTALHVACIYRRPAIVELLMLHNANPNVIDRFGRTPVILTVTYWPRVAMMNAENKGYAEVVMKTIPRKSYRCLECLCINGANVNGRFGSQDETPLHLAARYHISSCIQVLLKFGASVNAIDKKGMTALHYACKRVTTRKDDLELISILYKYGANVNQQDYDGNSPLHIAAQNGCCTFISELISYGANAELNNKRKLTPLYLMLDREYGDINFETLNTLLNECTYLRIFDSYKLPSLLRLPELNVIRTNLMLLASAPPTLKLICRQFIRKTIGIRNLCTDVVATLPLPTVLQTVILRQINYVCDIMFL